MKRFQRVSKRVKVRTPGERTVWHLKEKRVSHAACGKCGAKLNKARLNKMQIKKLSKIKKRPGRPFPGLCSRCMREAFKKRIRG